MVVQTYLIFDGSGHIISDEKTAVFGRSSAVLNWYLI